MQLFSRRLISGGLSRRAISGANLDAYLAQDLVFFAFVVGETSFAQDLKETNVALFVVGIS